MVATAHSRARQAQGAQQAHPAPEHPAALSEKHQKGRAARERQRHRQESGGSKMPLIVGGVVGAILVIVIAIYLLVGGPEPQAPVKDGGLKATPAPAVAPATPAAEAPVAPAAQAPTVAP